MKYPTQCEIWRSASREPSRFAINDACLKGDHLMVTNGKSAVFVPVERDKADKDGMVPVKILKIAKAGTRQRTIKKAGFVPGIRVGRQAVSCQCKDSKHSYSVDNDVTFPNARAVIPNETDLNGGEVHLSGKILIDLLMAMGAHKSEQAVRIRLQKKAGAPVLLEAKIEHNGDGCAFDHSKLVRGVIMPMRVVE